MRLALIALLCATSVVALADERGTRTENRTGAWWRTIESEEKAVYLTGLRDGALLGVYYGVPKKEEDSPCREQLLDTYLKRDAVLSSVPSTDLVEQLDQFYRDRANDSVMVPAAMFYLSRKAAGDSPKVLKDLLDGFRRNDG